MAADLDGAPVARMRPIDVRAGSALKIGSVTDRGCRAYLAVRGGFDVPDYLGSRSTFTLGKFGGHGGRALIQGDVLHLGDAAPFEPCAIPAGLAPAMAKEWEIGVLPGPHGAPDFFTDDDVAGFFAASWEVHYNSNRTGVRLIGPKPRWSRTDGGEAGLHPSNIHDNAYAIGTVDFTGDMPVILGPDGPSLGGFVCPVTIVQAELWKIGQLRPNDRVRFKRLSPAQAAAMEARQEAAVAAFEVPSAPRVALPAQVQLGPDAAILATFAAERDHPQVVYRRSGDKYLLVEYGPLVLDLELRLRAHALMLWLKANAIPGIIDLTPGIRSLQIHYDSRIVSLKELLSVLEKAETELPGLDEVEVPTRIVRLPLSWDDDATRLAIAKYMQSVRADAPWCPDNIEFIRRINGLDSVDEVRRIVFDASYLVLGLGDVYLGAPVTTPIDPRHRLVTTKYNPARTWTPENAVGIGGAYLCVYGMEGPGGYQFVGRTCQMWNTFRTTTDFEPGRPWLLRFFDQIRFFPVSGKELLDFRADFALGRVKLDISQETFRLKDYRRFLAGNETEIAAAKARQQAAFEAERTRWEAAGQNIIAPDVPDLIEDEVSAELPEGCVAVTSPVSGSVWKIPTVAGQRVAAGEALVLVESMKMEMMVSHPTRGTVVELRCAEGRTVRIGQVLTVFRPDQ